MYYCLVGILYVGILYGIVRDYIFVLVCFDGFFSCLEQCILNVYVCDKIFYCVNEEDEILYCGKK